MSTLQQDAYDAVRYAEFRSAWPLEVRKALVRAAQTDGEFPPFAVREVGWALKAARGIERRLAKDIAVGEAGLSQSQKRRLAAQR